jgi:hypothetical protein
MADDDRPGADVSGLKRLDFEIVSDFVIRISDFPGADARLMLAQVHREGGGL